MSMGLTRPNGVRRAVWVFKILDGDGQAPSSQGDEDLREVLGLSHLDPDQVEIFRAETLNEYGFANYLTEAVGLDAVSVAPDTDTLDALRGPVVLLYSQALEGGGKFIPGPRLELIGCYVEKHDVGIDAPLSSEAAEGVITGGKPKPSDAAMSGRIATIALVVILLLVGLMIWIGG